MRVPSIRSLASPLVAIFAMLPGFAFPFVITAVKGHEFSDVFFLAISVALVLCNVLGNTIELNSVVQIGRLRARFGGVPEGELRRYRRAIRKFTILSTLVGGPLLAGMYFFTIVPGMRAEFAIVAALVLAVPIIGGEASSKSGQVIAYGKQELAILLQALRTGLPLVVVIVMPDVTTIALASSMVLGEIARLAILSFVGAKLEATSRAKGGTLSTRGLMVQSLSTSTVQLAPVTDRMFLSSAPAGSVSAYELADKVFFAGVQFLNLSFLVRRVQIWSELRSMPAALGFKTLKCDLILLAVLSSGASILAVGGLEIAPVILAIPLEWHHGLDWAQLVLISLPVTMVSMACSRLLVVADQQKVLLWFASGISAATFGMDWILFGALGPVGIPIAAVVIRSLACIAYVGVTWRCLKAIVGSETMPSKVEERFPASEF